MKRSPDFNLTTRTAASAGQQNVSAAEVTLRQKVKNDPPPPACEIVCWQTLQVSTLTLLFLSFFLSFFLAFFPSLVAFCLLLLCLFVHLFVRSFLPSFLPSFAFCLFFLLTSCIPFFPPFPVRLLSCLRSSSPPPSFPQTHLYSETDNPRCGRRRH